MYSVDFCTSAQLFFCVKGMIILAPLASGVLIILAPKKFQKIHVTKGREGGQENSFEKLN